MQAVSVYIYKGVRREQMPVLMPLFFSFPFFSGVHGGGSRRCNKNVSVWCTLTTETTTTKWFWRLLFRTRVLLYFYTHSANPHHPKISENLWFSVSWFSQGGWVKYSIRNARVTTRNTAELDSLVATQFENNIQL